MSKPSGFSLVELMVVLIIVGILAVVAVPRLTGRTLFDARGGADSMISALQFLRQEAIAERRLVCVSVVTNGLVRVHKAAAVPPAACSGIPVIDPATGQGMVVTMPDGVSVSADSGLALPAMLVFDALGQVNAGGVLRVSGGDNAFCLQIEESSGYVHRQDCA